MTDTLPDLTDEELAILQQWASRSDDPPNAACDRLIAEVRRRRAQDRKPDELRLSLGPVVCASCRGPLKVAIQETYTAGMSHPVTRRLELEPCVRCIGECDREHVEDLECSCGDSSFKRGGEHYSDCPLNPKHWESL